MKCYIFMILLMLMSFSCNDGTTRKDVKEEHDEYVETNDQYQEEVKKATNELRAKLADLEMEMNKKNAEIANSGNSLSEDQKRQWSKLEAKKENIEVHIDQLDQAEEETWVEKKNKIEEKIDEIRESMNQIYE